MESVSELFDRLMAGDVRPEDDELDPMSDEWAAAEYDNNAGDR